MPAPTTPDAHTVGLLLREQCPRWADQRVRPAATSGSSNWVFRVGDAWAARLPRSDDDVDDLLAEARWLPRLAPQLEVAVPEVVFLGEPSEPFARPWSVVTWIPGANPGTLDAGAQARLAADLGRFLRHLHGLDLPGAEDPAPEVEALRQGYRAGEPVTEEIDGWAEVAADDLRDLFDPEHVALAWQRLRQVPPPSLPQCWIHADLSAENLLTTADGALAGVLDFGGLGIGDRSVDLLYAWSLFDPPAREVLRSAAGVDEDTWLRARAWAFVGPGLLTLAHYRATMPDRTARLTTMVEAVAAEVGVTLRRPV